MIYHFTPTIENWKKSRKEYSHDKNKYVNHIKKYETTIKSWISFDKISAFKVNKKLGKKWLWEMLFQANE